MSAFSYNYINFSYIRTDSVERIVNWSDDGVEYKFTEFVINLQLVYNPAATSYNALGAQGGYPVPGNLPVVTDVSIRHYLMQPRMPIFYSEGGTAILNIPSLFEDGSTIDANNGPTPLSCNIVRIFSSRMFYIHYSIKCSIIECPPNGVPSPIASSRYSRVEDIDQNRISTLRTSGTAYFRSNVLAALGTNADYYRGYLVPQQLSGYKRGPMSFTLSSDGLKLDWSVTDVEQIQDLGNSSVPGSAGSLGITQMGLKYHAGQVTASSLGMASLGSIITVETWADSVRGSDRYAVMLFLFRAAWDKLTNFYQTGYLSNCTIEEDVFNNHVQLNISYFILNDDAALNEVQLPITNVVGIPIVSLPNLKGVNPVPPFSFGTRGTACYMIAVNAFATACYTDPDTISTDTTGDIVPPDAYENNPQYGTSPQVQGYYQEPVPTPAPNVPSSRSGGMSTRGEYPGKNSYLKYEIKSNYKTDKGIITLPKTPPNPAQYQQPPCQSTSPAIQNYNPTCPPLPTVSNIMLFMPVTRKIVEFVIDRVGAVPEIPNPTINQYYQGGEQNPYYGNYTLLSNITSPIGTELAADGYSKVYRASGVYTYSCIYPLNDNATVPFDLPPWVNVIPGEYDQLQASDYEDGIINLPPQTISDPNPPANNNPDPNSPYYKPNYG